MSNQRDDGDLREQFQRLRRQDERLGRPFVALRQAARQQPPARSRGHLRQRLAVAALGLALAAGMGALHWLRPRTAQLPEEEAIARLTRWRAPTDSLLRAPGEQLRHSVPRLGESLIGGNSLESHEGNFIGGTESK